MPDAHQCTVLVLTESRVPPLFWYSYDVSRLGIVRIKGDREVNGYIVSCAATKEAIVIDPIEPVDKIVSEIGDLKVRWILASHGHPGHLAGKDEIQARLGGTTAMHVTDAKTFLRSADRYLDPEEHLQFGEFELRVLHTPGHTPGSLCFLVGNHLFTGDTLLAGGVGKQSPGADLRRQLFSILNAIAPLPPATAIYPGHGAVTSLERELRDNPAFRGLPPR